jgi:hypothetical protein
MNKYLTSLDEYNKNQAINNLEYRLGRFYKQLLKYEKAVICYKKSFHSKSFGIKLKSFILILILKMKIFKNYSHRNA